MIASSTDYMYSTLADPLPTSPTQLKKHKALPRPANEHDASEEAITSCQSPDSYHLIIDASYTLSSSASNYSPSSPPHTLWQSSRPCPRSPPSAGLDLPPTPPAHSRASSAAGHPTIQFALPTAEPAKLPRPPTPLRNPPLTPPDQRSPPTPDVTPPQPQTATKSQRHTRYDQSATAAASTSTDSRHNSFRTAREDQLSSPDHHGRMTSPSSPPQPLPTKTSCLAEATTMVPAHRHMLVSAPHSLSTTAPQLGLRAAMNKFRHFDGEWGPARQPEKNHRQQRDQAASRSQPVDSKRRRQILKTPIMASLLSSKQEVVEDNVITPTAAIRAARHVALHDNSSSRTSPLSFFSSISENFANVDARRYSASSVRSTSSAIVEVVVVDGPSRPPQPRPTLRHVKKQNLLRQLSRAPNQPSCASLDSHRRLPLPQRQRKGSPVRDRTRPPKTQTAPSNIGDGRARREIWNSGSIPVIVVPDRRSSNCTKSREPSLRSTSSRRSKRSASVGSHQHARASLDSSPIDPLQLRGRDPVVVGHDRTMDFAPSVPLRSSSLSAPTSRNTSCTTSLTAESIRAHNAAMQNRKDDANEDCHLAGTTLTPTPLVASPASPKKAADAQLSIDGEDLCRAEDAMSSKKYSSRNTPFSVTSVATTGTAPEVSEAFAVHMYPHQNSSILMVNHSARRSGSSDATAPEEYILPQLAPVMTTTDAQGGPPVTPPEQLTKTDDVDSPLRNPRAPPAPPVRPPILNLIPATPSGATLSRESLTKFGTLYEPHPVPRPSLMRRAFSLRRNSIDYPPTSTRPPGRRTRSFSLTRSLGLSSEAKSRPIYETDIDGEPVPRKSRKAPMEKEKLHPLWRPLNQEEECDCSDRRPRHGTRGTRGRCPVAENRPPLSRKSLGSRMKNTFAILPIYDDASSHVEEDVGPERRTIRRTPSGNLRVMQRRASMDSPLVPPQLWREKSETHPFTSLDQGRRSLWRGPAPRRTLSDADGTGQRARRFSLSDKLEEIQNIPRIFHEKRRVKRTEEFRQSISGPTLVRDGVGEVLRHGRSWKKQGNTWGGEAVTAKA